jgi:hypothetical protein
MGRTPKLSLALWTTVASVGAAACGSDDMTGRLADAPPGTPIDASPSAPIAVVPSALTASAACGVATPPAVDLTIANAGMSELVIRSATVDGGFTVATTLPATVAPGAHLAISVVPPAAVIGTDRGGTTKTGTLTLTTNETVSAAHTVALTANVLGANIDFLEPGGGPVTLFLTGTSGVCPAPTTVFIRNSGTETVMLGAATASGFAFGGFSGGTIEAGAMVSQDIRLITDGPCIGSDTIVYEVTGTVCSAPNASLAGAFNIGGGSSCFCS